VLTLPVQCACLGFVLSLVLVPCLITFVCFPFDACPILCVRVPPGMIWAGKHKPLPVGCWLSQVLLYLRLFHTGRSNTLFDLPRFFGPPFSPNPLECFSLRPPDSDPSVPSLGPVLTLVLCCSTLHIAWAPRVPSDATFPSIFNCFPVWPPPRTPHF